MRWTRRPKGERQSLSHIDFRRSKMLTKCECFEMYNRRLADLISSFFIKEGKVSECGTHDQLIAMRGDYYDYVQLQVLSKS